VTPQKHNGAHPAHAENSQSGTEFASFRALSEHELQAINGIIQGKDRLKLAQAQLREDVKTVAERLGMKPAELNRIVRLTMQEQERGNVLAHEKALIEVAEQIAG
jgi:CO/xanthine dehydrogenase Mo-binding subunit